jgi:hypothetical protein
MTVETILLESEDNCSRPGIGNFSHLKHDGVIIFGVGSLIYVLDEDTLKVR